MRLTVTTIAGVATLMGGPGLIGGAGAAVAQTVRQGGPVGARAGVDHTGVLNRQTAAQGSPHAAGRPTVEPRPAEPLSPWVATSRDVWARDAGPGQVWPGPLWADDDGRRDHVALNVSGPLRGALGGPLPGPFDAAVEAEHVSLTYSRLWPSFEGYTPSGLEISLTPHTRVGVGGGGALEAGATLRIGRGLDRLAPEGRSVFGDRPRWYVYAAGSGRAVGYNFARDRDGGYSRSGYSHDRGDFLGDAQLGVAVRRGSMQSSIGLVYRELDPGAVRSANGLDTDVSEGLVAFQLSIKP